MLFSLQNTKFWIYILQKLGTAPYIRTFGFVTWITMKKKIVFRSPESIDERISKPPHIDPNSIQLLKKCWKHGGYRKFFGRYIWSHKKIDYFDFKNNIYGGLPHFLKSAEVLKCTSIQYFPTSQPPNQVSKYTFTLKKAIVNRKYDFDEAFSFSTGGANSFQHFVQDCLPIIANTVEFLQNRPQLILLLEKPNINFTSQEILIRKLGIKNAIFYTGTVPLKIKNFYYWNFEPFNARLILPSSWYNRLNSCLEDLSIDKQKKYLTLITRKESTRNFQNEKDLIQNLKNIANELNLEFALIESHKANLIDYSETLPKTKILIAMHGGASFNSIFLTKNSIFFEFIPIQNTNSSINFVSGMGVHYVPVPVDFNLTQQTPIVIEKEQLCLIKRASDVLLHKS